MAVYLDAISYDPDLWIVNCGNGIPQLFSLQALMQLCWMTLPTLKYEEATRLFIVT